MQLKRTRNLTAVLVVVLALIAGACSSSGDRSTSIASGGEATSTTSRATTDKACEGQTLKATETGITADTVNVTVMADTGSAISPGLANGAVEATQAWAKVVNAGGGLACRKVVVETYDSKLNPNEVSNGYTKGCQNSLAMVGTYALFVADVSAAAECKDMAGAVTGMPDFAAVSISPAQNCNPTTFLVFYNGDSCPPKQGTRDIKVSTSLGKYMSSVLGKDAHGLYVLSNATPTLIAGSVPGFHYMQEKQGLAADLETGSATNATQATYTPMVVAMKDKGSTFGYFQPTYQAYLSLRKEASAQGLKSVKLWMCSVTCYDDKFLEAAKSQPDVYGTQMTLTAVPYEDAPQVPEMQTFVDSVPNRNNFAMNAWIAARLFEQSVNEVVKAHGPNGLTRARIVEAANAVKDFTANGLVGKTTPSAKAPAPCGVIVEAKADGFHRVLPKKPGTFDCNAVDTITIDPAAAYKG